MAKYTKQTWTDGSSQASAARLGYLETGIYDASVARGTSLPASPVDGEMYDYIADSTNGIVWRFLYRSASESSYKWEFIGGPPMSAEVLTLESTASTSYVDLATAGPTVTVPLDGDYLYQFNFRAWNTAVQGNVAALKLGAAATSDDDSAFISSEVALAVNQTGKIRRVTGLAASAALKLQYKTASGTASFLQRNLHVWPIRVI